MCRRNGLETKRRCSWLQSVIPDSGPPVWARKDITLNTCPKSYISAESEALVEEFLVWRRLGGAQLTDLSARQVDAFMILDRTLAEVNRAQQSA